MPITSDPLHNVDLDTALKAAFDNIAGVQQQSVQGAVAGSASASGVVTVTGSQKGIATGLATVTNVVASMVDATGVFEIVTASPTPNAAGRIDIYVWKAASTASTTARQVHWQASGTPVSGVAP